MILLPAVDIHDGRAVRLQQGDFARETVYEDDPVEAARLFGVAGARALHVVDLDGAREGEPTNLGHLERIVRELGLPVQYGGGLRSLKSVQRALGAGVERVIIGTAALTDAAFLEQVLNSFRDEVAVGVDVRGGRVSVKGWTEETAGEPEQVLAELGERGVSRVVYTSVERDGMLEGPDLEEVRGVCAAFSGEVVYSGGIGSLDELRELRELGLSNLVGVISGKALYEGRFEVGEAQAVLDP
ncbi:MAG: 1-(5-phosphoribosyl)-5-[(5-phosphoribosylamino)methylideneamino]imidazole-4-carboxamide isomerase [Actinomycetota bacterium]|nr:1-(5-phosphoribosyl)-5-[(5-phosphoribosylamino)methylideneamino]imidazole-4-carboxamide isomerase [Actinomycetota bacterium]